MSVRPVRTWRLDARGDDPSDVLERVERREADERRTRLTAARCPPEEALVHHGRDRDRSALRSRLAGSGLQADAVDDGRRSDGAEDH
jgi:hypothetical protein